MNITSYKTVLATVASLSALTLATQAQSVVFTFSDATSDGWANSGFGDTPAATVVNISGQNYISLPVGGFQVGNVTSSTSTLSDFGPAMAAAAANPAGYQISYNYYIDTSTWTGSPTYLQVGTFVNSGSGYYAQDYGSPRQLQLDGTAMASGLVYSGTVSVTLAASAYAIPTADTFFRLGLIVNSNGTGVVDFTDISVAPVPEPSTFALCALSSLGGMWALRRRKA